MLFHSQISNRSYNLLSFNVTVWSMFIHHSTTFFHTHVHYCCFSMILHIHHLLKVFSSSPLDILFLSVFIHYYLSLNLFWCILFLSPFMLFFFFNTVQPFIFVLHFHAVFTFFDHSFHFHFISLFFPFLLYLLRIIPFNASFFCVTTTLTTSVHHFLSFSLPLLLSRQLLAQHFLVFYF